MTMEPHDFWQEILPPDASASLSGDADYTATLADGRRLRLPIRPLPDGRHGLASLIINQASFAVLDALATDLAAHLADFEPDVVVGLPTLGLTLAAEVARKLGHTRYVPLGTSRNFWYAEALSVPLSSVTTPDQVKRLYTAKNQPEGSKPFGNQLLLHDGELPKLGRRTENLVKFASAYPFRVRTH